MAVFRYKMQGILDIKEKLEDKAKQEFGGRETPYGVN